MIAQMLDEKIGGLATMAAQRTSSPGELPRGRRPRCRTWPSAQRWVFSSVVGPILEEPSQAVRRGAYRGGSPPWLRERDPRFVHESYHRRRQNRQNSHVPHVLVSEGRGVRDSDGSAYHPITDYALIGDCRSAALVDWRRGGRFRIAPVEPFSIFERRNTRCQSAAAHLARCAAVR
jgi:hypothetical protein